MFGQLPLVILVGGAKLTGYTSFKLSRRKADLTGSCQITLFLGYVPDRPVFASIVAGAEIQVFVGGEIAFTGTIDARKGKGSKGGDRPRDELGRFTSGGGGSGSATISVDKDTYELSVSARGKTKHLIGSSHQHKTTNMKSPTTKDVVETLVGPFGVGVEWKAATIKLDRIRFRDGAHVFHELVRIGSENGHYIYETRQGKLRVIDGPSEELGEDIVLGENILSFNAEQTEVPSNSEIMVKGQRTEVTTWGKSAVRDTLAIVRDGHVLSYSPKILQHYGDGTKEALQRRAKFEADKRTESSKEVKVDVFHIQTRSGAPWDIGTLHYVEIPPEGVFDVMECTGIDYTVEASGTLKTSLTLSPVSSGGLGGGGGLSSFSSLTAAKSLFGASRRSAAGIVLQFGTYPGTWSGSKLSLASELLSAGANFAATAARGLASFVGKVGP